MTTPKGKREPFEDAVRPPAFAVAASWRNPNDPSGMVHATFHPTRQGWSAWQIDIVIIPNGRIREMKILPNSIGRPVLPGGEPTYDEDRDLTTSMFRELPIAAMRRAALDYIRQELEPFDRSKRGQREPNARRWVTEWDRPGRRGRPDYDYAVLAEKYVRLLSERRPIEVLAEREQISPAHVRNMLHEARRRELLTRVGQGRAGGELTEKAMRELEANDGAR
jgi:hypothetical protein